MTTERDWNFGTMPKACGITFQSWRHFSITFGKYPTNGAAQARRTGRTPDEIAEVWLSRASDAERAAIEARLAEAKREADEARRSTGWAI